MERNWEHLGFGTYPVTVIPHYVHVLNDGTEIAAKLWLPWKPNSKNRPSSETQCDDDLLFDQQQLQQQRFPAILEYLPYRKSDYTAPRDHCRHSRLCSHGYVCVRADQRGSGDSTGFYHDEYDPQEQTDCAELIRWLSTSAWSNGRVGMYGKSWGGFNGLQVAYNRPPGLSAVISLYSTDDRFADDIHYVGGCLMASCGNLNWSSVMQAWNARPMTPKYCRNFDDFRRRWKERLERSTVCWATQWLRHQNYDDYWKHGSICENYSAVECPILIIGGLQDGYINAAFRMAALLNHRSRAIIGPWNHDWPDVSVAGPTVDFIGICLNWFDYHLKGKEIAAEDVSKWPTLRVFCQAPFKPLTEESHTFEGVWYDIPKWMEIYKNFKNDKFDNAATKTFYFGGDEKLLENETESIGTQTKLLPKPHLFQGLFVGEWISFDKLCTPGCQNMSNMFCSVWTSESLMEPLNLCGFSRLDFSAESNKSGKYSVAAKLCHVWPDGEISLITCGICNVNNFVNTPDVPENQPLQCTITLKATTYTVPKEHKICIALSPTLMPMSHPSPKCDGNLLLHWNKCKLNMQILPKELRSEFKGFPDAKPLLEFSIKDLEKRNCLRKVEFELYNTNLVKISQTSNYKCHYPSLDLDYGERLVDVIETDFEASFCRISIKNSVEMNFKDSNGSTIKTKVDTSNVMTSDENEFNLNNRVLVHLNDAVFFDKAWTDNVPRVYV